MKPLLTLSIERNDLLAMQKLCSSDGARYILNGVHFECGKKRTLLVATNGVIFGVLKCEPPMDGELEFQADVSLVKLFKPTKSNSQLINIEVFESEVAFSFNQIKIVGKKIEGNYPQWKGLVPKTKPCFGKFTFNASFVKTLNDVAHLLTKNGAFVQLVPHEDDGKFSEMSPYSVLIPDCKRFFGLLMPMRASEPEIPDWLKE